MCLPCKNRGSSHSLRDRVSKERFCKRVCSKRSKKRPDNGQLNQGGQTSAKRVNVIGLVEFHNPFLIFLTLSP